MGQLKTQNVYLDTNTIIYAFEKPDEFQNLRSGLLDLMDAGRMLVTTSELTLLEILVKPRRNADKVLEQAYRDFLSPNQFMHREPIHLAILERAIDLRAEFNFKTPDAIHIATGILAGCDAFISRDSNWARAGIRVIEPQNL